MIAKRRERTGVRAAGSVNKDRRAVSRAMRRRRDGRPTPDRDLAVRLEQPRRALAAADAHGDDAVAGLAAQHLVGEGADQREPVMPNGWPIEIEPPLTLSFVRVDAEPVAAVDDLRGERLVQLPQVDVVDLRGRGASAASAPRTRARCPSRPARSRRPRSRGRRACGWMPSAFARSLDMSRVAAGAVGELRGVAGRHRALAAGPCRSAAAASAAPRASCRGGCTRPCRRSTASLPDDLARLLVEDAARRPSSAPALP